MPLLRRLLVLPHRISTYCPPLEPKSISSQLGIDALLPLAGFGESLTAIGSSIISSTTISSTTTSSITLIIGAGCGVELAEQF